MLCLSSSAGGVRPHPRWGGEAGGTCGMQLRGFSGMLFGSCPIIVLLPKDRGAQPASLQGLSEGWDAGLSCHEVWGTQLSRNGPGPPGQSSPRARGACGGHRAEPCGDGGALSGGDAEGSQGSGLASPPRPGCDPAPRERVQEQEGWNYIFPGEEKEKGEEGFGISRWTLGRRPSPLSPFPKRCQAVSWLSRRPRGWAQYPAPSPLHPTGCCWPRRPPGKPRPGRSSR